MRALRGRLLLGTAIGTGLVLSASAVALYAIVRAALWTEFDEALAAKARSLAALVEQDGGELELEFDEDSLPEYKPGERAEYYEFWTSGGHVLARSPSLGGGHLARDRAASDEPAYAYAALPDGRRGRFLQITVTPRQEEADRVAQTQPTPAELILVVARETREVDRALGRLRALLAGGCAGAIVVSVLVLSWVVGRGLGPLGRVAAEIAAIGENDLSSRVSPGGAPAELGPVVARLNDLLARLETAFERERAFTADVAHELRTPLAGLRSILEVSLSKERAAAAHREAIAKSLAVSQQMQRLVENLLEMARADAGQLDITNEPLDLVALVKACWTQFADRATKRRLEVTWNLPDSCLITSDSAKTTLVLNNVFDNAVTYADVGGRVTIALQRENGQATVRVANTGSVVAESDTEKVFDRFWRGDAARTTGAGDRRYGLGLALCRRLMALLGGSITATTASHGTFTILILFMPVLRPR